MMRDISVLIKPFLAAWVGLLLASCAGPHTVSSVETLPAGKGVVFGRIDVIQSNNPRKFGMLEVDRVLLLPVGSREATQYQVDKDGSFYWDLKPGEYMILGMPVAGGNNSGVHQNRIGVTFAVPEGSKSSYIGDLRLVSKTSTHYVLIHDEHDRAFAAFRKRFPKAQSPETNLMQQEERVGSYTRLMYICSGEWGIECDSEYRGVKPLQPEVKEGSFTEMGSLEPYFEWEASENDDVSYDLVIYEAAAVNNGGGDREYMPGRLVFYREDIKNPRFRLTKPLQPKTNYYWSIRLRRDDVVSSWSTFGHYNFIVVGLTLAEGQWFEFSTPAQ